MKKETKQQTIDRLTEALQKEKTLSDKYYVVLKKVAEELKVEGYYDYEKVEKILPAIAALKAEKNQWRIKCEGFEGKLDERVNGLSRENARVWYLVRAMINDETLEGEKSNHQEFKTGRNSPYNQADF